MRAVAAVLEGAAQTKALTDLTEDLGIGGQFHNCVNMVDGMDPVELRGEAIDYAEGDIQDRVMKKAHRYWQTVSERESFACASTFYPITSAAAIWLEQGKTHTPTPHR